MSRSLTPKELYQIDQICHFSQNIIKMINSENNMEIIIYDNTSDFSKSYPNLSFLLSDSENKLKNISKETLSSIETNLDFIINNTKFTPENELQLTVSKWFHGQLDKHFYYSELNDKIFIDYIVSIDTLSKEGTKEWKP